MTLVGKVLSAAERGGGIDLKITDGTGTTDVQWAAWAEADASVSAAGACRGLGGRGAKGFAKMRTHTARAALRGEAGSQPAGTHHLPTS